MGCHYRRKESLIRGLLKLALLAALSFALLFVLCRLYPDKISPSLCGRAEVFTVAVESFKSRFAFTRNGGSEDPKIRPGTVSDDKGKEMPPLISKDIKGGEEESPIEVQGRRPILAIVVDDGGNDLKMAQKAASFDLPLTWAILPYTRYAKQTADAAESKGIPYLLHLPMQAEIDKDPKAYLVGDGMDRSQIREITSKALDSFPSPIGINNHRGSLATSKWDIMVPVIDVLKERKLCFLDSRTSGNSVAYEAAKAAGIPAFKNRGFLDGTPDKDSIGARFDQIIKTTVKRGDMIVICHFRPATLLFLEGLDREYRDLPVRLVTLTEMAEILSKAKEDEEE